jgi:hypothetical protein
VLLVKHRGHLAADLHRFHGIRLAQVRRSGYTPGELADYAANLPPDGAVARAVNPDWALTPEAFLLREIEYGVRILVWQQTADGHRKDPQNYPKPTPLTHAEIEASTASERTYDVMSIDEANEFLGWPTTA